MRRPVHPPGAAFFFSRQTRFKLRPYFFSARISIRQFRGKSLRQPVGGKESNC